MRMTNRGPNVRPNFSRINKKSAELLLELGNPAPPIQLDELIGRHGWKIEYDELFGPDGYTARVKKRSGNRYCIFVATDVDGAYDEIVMKKRQRFTVAHEIGHIVLHDRYDWTNTNESFSNLLEYEAQRFASKLLMPDYVFESVADLSAETLADKCDVNFRAANIRITGLSGEIRNRLIRAEVEWPDYRNASLDEFDYANWASLETAAGAEPAYVCDSCGQPYSIADHWITNCPKCGMYLFP